MGAVDTTYTFTATDTITSTKMNNIIDQTTMTTDAIIGTTLEVASGKLKVRSAGITSNELAAGSVTENGIASSAVTEAKIASDSITQAKMADSSIGTAELIDANVTASKLNGAQTGSAPIFGIRAWVNFDATRDSTGASNTSNTNRFIRSSGNISSVLKNGNNDYTVSFSIAMPNTNYAVAASTAPLNGRFASLYEGGALTNNSADGALTTASVRIVVHNGSTTTSEPDVVTLIVTG